MAAKDYGWYRRVYQDASVSGIVATGSAGADNIIAVKSSLYTIYVQKITVNIKTSAAQTINFQDDAGTPVVAAHVEASAAEGVVRTFDFGAKGFALTVGKNLDISGTAGPAYSYSVEAYQRQTGVDQATTIDRTI